MAKKTFHSVCRWSFHSGKGGFVPSDVRKEWAGINSLDVVKIIKDKIIPRIPDDIQLGYELHYDTEVNEKNAKEMADALVESKISLAMMTPGAHSHFAYGGIASLDKNERKAAEDYGRRAIELTYGQLKKAWNPDNIPTFVLWNGSFGYDLGTIGVQGMYKNLKESIADLCKTDEKLGKQLFIAIEPKPNEGHPAMLIPTVASALLLWKKLEKEFGISLVKKGVNKEFGHTEMIGLDLVYDTVEEIDNDALVHMHVNSQGYSDGIILGGPGKYDIDHGVRINGTNITIAALLKQYGYKRWKGHDIQPRPYDDEDQAVDRIIRSILSWEACEKAADELDDKLLLRYLSERQTAKAEDLMRGAVVTAQNIFDRIYK